MTIPTIFFLFYLLSYLGTFLLKTKTPKRLKQKVEIWRYDKSVYEVVHLRFWRCYIAWVWAEGPKICDSEFITRSGVEDTRLEAKTKDTKKIRGLGQGQPFRGQTLSRPRTKNTSASALQKKKVFTKIFQKKVQKNLYKKKFSKNFFKRFTKF